MHYMLVSRTCLEQNNLIFPNRKICEKCGIILYFCIFLMFGLTEIAWIIITPFAFDLLKYVVLVEICEKKSSPIQMYT